MYDKINIQNEFLIFNFFFRMHIQIGDVNITFEGGRSRTIFYQK